MKRELLSLTPQTRAEPGSIQYDLYQSVDHKNEFVRFEGEFQGRQLRLISELTRGNLIHRNPGLQIRAFRLARVYAR